MTVSLVQPTTNPVFVHIDNRWRMPGLATQIRKALVTIGTNEIHCDPSARLPITVAKSLGIGVVEHIADWTTRGGAIDRTRNALAKCIGALVITDGLTNDRYGANVLRQARTAGKAGFLLTLDGFHEVDMERVPPFAYTELDSTPYEVKGKLQIADDVWRTDADLS